MTEPARVVERLGEELLRALPRFRTRRRRRRVVAASFVGAIVVVTATAAVITRVGDEGLQPVVVMNGADAEATSSAASPSTPSPAAPAPSGPLAPDPVWRGATTTLRVSDAPQLFWTGSEVLVVESSNWGEQVIGERWDPATDTAVPMAPSGLSWRHEPAMAWTGTELLVIGGSSGEGFSRDGRAYDPVADRWRPLADAPTASDERRVGGPGVWTGTELVLWASDLAYDPQLDRWRSIAPPPLSERRSPVTVWTGTEIIVWGGCDQRRTPQCAEANVDLLADGAIYDPRTDAWTALPATPLTPAVHAVAAWDGRDVVVVVTDPGADGAGARTAAYSPVARTWRTLTDPPLSSRRYPGAVWTGTSVVIWGGDGAAADGAAYDPSTDTWAALPASPGPGRALPSMVSTGGPIYISATRQAPQPLLLNVPAGAPVRDTTETAPSGPLSLPELAGAAAPFDVVVPVSATDDLSLTMRVAPSLLPGSEGNDLCLILTGAGGGAGTSCQSAALVGQVHHLAADWGGTGWQPSLGPRVVTAVASGEVSSIRVSSMASSSDVIVVPVTPFEIPGVGWLGTTAVAIDPAWSGPVEVVALDASGAPLAPPSLPNGSGAVRGALVDGRPFLVWDEPGRGLCITLAEEYLGCADTGPAVPPDPTTAGVAANRPQAGEEFGFDLAYGVLPGSAAHVQILLADGTLVDEGLVLGGADGTIWAAPLPPDERPVEAIFTANDGTVIERQPLL